MKITHEILTEYLKCKYKAYLILSGHVREPSRYEQWLRNHEERYAGAATRALIERGKSCVVATNSRETTEHLKQGIATVIGAESEDELHAFSFHALQRVPGASPWGQFPGAFSSNGYSCFVPTVEYWCPALLTNLVRSTSKHSDQRLRKSLTISPSICEEQKNQGCG